MTIHVDDNPPHWALTFADTNGEPILRLFQGAGWIFYVKNERGISRYPLGDLPTPCDSYHLGFMPEIEALWHANEIVRRRSLTSANTANARWGDRPDKLELEGNVGH